MGLGIKNSLLILIFLGVSLGAFAEVDYDKLIDYSKLNPEAYLQDARKDMVLSETTEIKDEEIIYLDRATRNYYLVYKIDNNIIEAQIGLAKCYERLGEKKLCLRYINSAIDLDKFNPELNYYLGDYYFRNEKYRKSLDYYLTAMSYGYFDEKIDLKLACLYEKLGDLKAAKIHYKNALRFDEKNEEILEKIRILDELKYEETQYYLRYE